MMLGLFVLKKYGCWLSKEKDVRDVCLMKLRLVLTCKMVML